jgi:probable rRNA maturation factor
LPFITLSLYHLITLPFGQWHTRRRDVLICGMSDKLRIEMGWRLRRDWHALPLLRRVARFVAQAEGFRCGRLSVSVVGRRAMSALHLRSLGLAEPTDVLSFDYGTDRRRALLDGEVVLCADVALQRARHLAEKHAHSRLAARSLMKTARAELALYLTHGILHLSGYDDQTPRRFQRMHTREDELLCALGLGPLFSASD